MRWIRGLALVALMTAVVLPGCGPSLSEEELGTVEFEVPEVDGSEEPYALPPATTPAAEAPDANPLQEGLPTNETE